MKKALTLLFIGALTAAIGLIAQTRSAADLFQEALQYEEVKGDLEKAIEGYQTILSGFAGDRSIAAKAQLHLAFCYELLGRPEAADAYRKVIRDYAGELNLVKQAEARLSGLAPRPATEAGTALRENLQAWTGSEVNLDGMPSSDGRYLSFVDYSLRLGNVAVRDLKTRQNRLLTHSKSAAEGSVEYPVISPDGTLVAYGWTAHDGYSIRVIKFDGSAMRIIATPTIDNLYSQVAWSPDGKRLAIVANAKDRSRQIALVTVADGSIATLLSAPEVNGLGGFSPDGRFLTFSAAPGGAAPSDSNSDVFTIAVDGSTKTPLVQEPSRDASPMWTPDGRAIVFVSDRSGTASLWAVGVSNGKPTTAPVQIRPDIGSIGNMGFARSGTFFYGFWINESDVYLASVDPVTLAVTSPPTRLTDRSPGLNSTPHWSPDGRSIAFLRGADRWSKTIVIRSLANGVERTLPTRIVDAFFTTNYGLAWYPDGRSLLLRDKHPTNAKHATVRRIDIDSGQEVVLFEAADWDVAAPLKLSPDGAALYYTVFSRDTTRDINHLRFVRRDLASGHVTQLFEKETGFYSVYGLLVAPDNSRVVFLDSIGSRPRTLVSLPVAGGAPRELHPSDAAEPRPTSSVGAWMRDWTPDGRAVITKTTDGGVWTFPIDGGMPRKLDWALPAVGDLSPDGTTTVFQVGTQRRELRTIDNLLSRIPAGE